MNFRVFFIITFLLILSCGTNKNTNKAVESKQSLQGITKEYYEDGTLKFEWNYKNNTLNGISKEYHKDGTYSHWKYEKGKLVEGISFYKNGSVLQKYTFVDGKREGSAYRYYETGEKEIIWEFKNDVLISGFALYKTGERKIDFKYKNGEPHGISKEYFKNGKIKVEWKYENGKLNGKSKEYYENGNLKFIWTYNNNEVQW